PLGDTPPQEALKKGRLDLVMEGERLHGSWVLLRLRRDREKGKRTNWLLIKRTDPAAHSGDADKLLAEDRSVASGRTMADIAAGKGPGPKPFMLAARQPARSDAVWKSNRREQPQPRRAASAAKAKGTRLASRRSA
ncbi:MAG TPA: ATP-dependent DNA ligase, partial [Alphaproteobacteria bacterium]